MDGCRDLNSSSSRRVTARFFSGLKKRLGKAKSNLGDERKQEEEDDEIAPPDHVTDSDGPDKTTLAGCCLLNLIAESKDELQKMAELKIQMQTDLQNVKEQLRLLVAKKLESNDDESLDCKSNLGSDKVLFNQSLKCDDHVPMEEKDSSEGMERLEAELQAELERLQLHLDSGELSTIPPQETIEESNINSTTSARSFSLSYGEIIDLIIGEEQDCLGLQSGVPPFELERKLHELLETRQQQQIRELEAALESAGQEIYEKEREISWWKDTALFLSRHV